MSSDVQQRQNQSAGIHLLQSNKEESLVCEKEKESGALKQDPENGNPSFQSDDLQQRQNAARSIKREEGASDMVKEETKNSNQENQYDKITEKSRNPDVVHKLQADEESIPREIPKTIDDAVTHKSDRIVSVKKEKAPDDVLSLVSDIPASQYRQQKSTDSTIPEKALSKLDIVATPSSFVHVIPKQESEQCSLLCNEEKSVSLEKNTLSDDNFSQIPTSEQHHFSFSAKPEKAEKLPPRRNPDPGVQGLQSDPESKVPEKAVDDGYNWRKYGQKLVKGNEFIRSYYRCTFPNCLAKKQLERSHDGNLKDINYLGNHEHPKPQHSPHVPAGLLVRRPESSASGAVPEPITAHEDASQCTELRETTQPSPIAETADGEAGAEKCNENDGCPDSKRQKTEISGVVDNLLNKPNIESRHVVHTISEIDIVNDGYRWRKYGQKFVKGNPNPRSYYRCTYAGCPVKKHVERASHDPKMVITTYEGQHEHGIGTTSSSASSSKTAAGSESRSTHAENKPVGLDMAVHISANS